MLKNEKGQALPLVLIALTIGTLGITPFLNHAGTSLLGSRIFGQAIKGQYSSDSGVEHAIWRLADDGLAGVLVAPGDSVSYSLGESINGLTPDITVSNAWETIASDNFESGTWSGGSGWLGDWETAGDAGIVTSDVPYEGSYHLQLRQDTGYARRSADLSAQSGAHLQFYAKANSFEPGETAQCLVSENGTDWAVVNTWVDGDDDNAYHFYNIDLSAYRLTSQFWIAFQANMSGTGDYLFVDDLKIAWQYDYVAPFASDDFESGTWSGGTGWLGGWEPAGDAAIVTAGTPHEGAYHLRLRDNTGYARRSVDLSGRTEARLQFYAKADSLEAAETAQCLVSENGTAWTVAHTWVNGDDDGIYRFYDIDLSPYTLTSQFWIAFQANMSGTGDYLYVDDLKIRGNARYGITARAGDRIIKAVVEIAGGNASVLSWWVK